jgi:predicted NUDIX family NTP pyrophosphohydrolase
MKKRSAGLIVYRRRKGQIEVLMAHMGAPWWAKKDAGAWTVPKGEIEEGEEPLATAKREFLEELGLDPPEGEYMALGDIEQQNNKTVTAWAVEGDLDANHVVSNTFETEWPPRSGKKQRFPEIDRAEWKNLEEAAAKSVRGQAELFKRLAEKLGERFDPDKKAPEPKQNSLF